MATRRSYDGDKKRATFLLNEQVLATTKKFAEASATPGGASGVVEDALRQYIASNAALVSNSLTAYASSTPSRVAEETESLQGFIESLEQPGG